MPLLAMRLTPTLPILGGLDQVKRVDMPSLCLAQDAEADRLLSTEPLALLIGMVLDQQIPLEWAFRGPAVLKHRLDGHLDAGEIAAMDPDALVAVFSQRPALHRFPAANAGRVQALCRALVDHYDGKADAVWATAATGAELYHRVRKLPGFGEHKARIFVALLAKQLGVQPPGWEEQAGEFGDPGVYRSVADITDADSLARVRQYKQECKAQAKAKTAAAKE
jgi:uncharacterized HhH-GPD family protein